MRPQEIIAKKRDGGELNDEEIASFIDGVCDGSWADYQISALIMAMVIRGMGQAEQDSITNAMLHSGEVLDFSDIPKPKADKHSTGGVGDKTSLIIAPLAAACGLAVPMISGRGLGHTGGTLDKLESIPGYRVNLSADEFHRVIDECGFAMAGQTADIAPADKKIYALRDATATVPCIPLIVASIMSKKLAEGLDALILDVKTGSGAFMPDLEGSKALATALVRTGEKFGVRTEAVISNMGQPLGLYVGNALEVYECVKILRGEAEKEMAATIELSLELTARLLVLAGIASDVETASGLAMSKLDSGDALERFRSNIHLQGGDPSVCDRPENLLQSGLDERAIKAAAAGYVSAIDTLAIGNSIAALGGGRTRAEDLIDQAVGYASLAAIGDRVSEGDALGILYCRNDDGAAAEQISNAYTIGDAPAAPPEIVKAVI
ncbi:MAG: thymidine phosphorylase [Pyrinomonadaceae bacterium]